MFHSAFISFGAGAAFAWLAVVPLLLIFYILKQKREERVIASILLWKQVLADAQANTPFQKLRRHLLLFLQLLFLLLLIFALARPQVKGESLEAGRQVLILDCSASMKTKEGDKTRWVLALEKTREIVNALNSSDQMMIVECADRVQQLQGFTNNKNLLLKALSLAKAKDTAGEYREALVLAASAIRGTDSAIIHVISDGAAPPLSEFEDTLDRIRFHRIGTSSNNIAITNFNLGLLPYNEASANNNTHAIFLRLHNYTDTARVVNIAVTLDDTELNNEDVVIPAREDLAHTFKEYLPEGLLTISLRESISSGDSTPKPLQDDFPTDNIARAFLTDHPTITVVPVTNGDGRLMKLLRSAPPYIKVLAPCPPDSFPPSEDFNFAIFDNCAPANAERYSFLCLNPPTDIGVFEVGEEIEAPPITDWDKQNPLTRYCDFSLLHVSKSHRIKSRGPSTVIINSLDSPLALSNALAGNLQIITGFHPSECDPPWEIQSTSSYALALFVLNVLDNARLGKIPSKLQTGESFVLYAPEDVKDGQAILPDGEKKILKKEGNSFAFDMFNQTGVYDVSLGDADYKLCANLLNDVESNITPRERFQPKAVKARTDKLATDFRDVWPYFALVALLLLLLEWVAYQRNWGT